MTTMTTTPVTRRQSRRAAILWISIIVGLLSLEISLCSWGMYCATKTQPAIEQDYYNKALHWDDTHKHADITK